jgi:hypothetical protein
MLVLMAGGLAAVTRRRPAVARVVPGPGTTVARLRGRDDRRRDRGSRSGGTAPLRRLGRTAALIRGAAAVAVAVGRWRWIRAGDRAAQREHRCGQREQASDPADQLFRSPGRTSSLG